MAPSLGGSHEVPAAGGHGIVGPKQSFLHAEVVVITKAVALVDDLAQSVRTGGVEVVLHGGVGDVVVTHGVGIDVVDIGSAEQVVHGLEVMADVLSELESGVPGALFAYLLGVGRAARLRVRLLLCLASR